MNYRDDLHTISFPEIELFTSNTDTLIAYQDYQKELLANPKSEFEIWEFKIGNTQYLLSIKHYRNIIHYPTPFKKMEGKSSTREEAFNYLLKSYGNNLWNYAGKICVRSYSHSRKDMTKKALVNGYHNIKKLASMAGYNITNNNFPSLEPTNRKREYESYNNEIRDLVVYEYLFHSRTHRWLDENILGLNANESRGYQSMGILHFIGIKDLHKGIFRDKSIHEALSIICDQESEFYLVIQCFNRIINWERLKELVKNDIDSDLTEEDFYHKEGTVKDFYGKRYERNPINRAKAIEIHGFNCKCCGFNFEEMYGERGQDFIEVHHINPLSTIKEGVVINPDTDLVPLCSNCHRMIHRKKDEVLTVEELKQIILKNKKVTL